MTEENTPKKSRRKRKAKEVAETPIVMPEPIPTPEPQPEPEERYVPEPEPAVPAFVEEVRTSPATYANPRGEYIPNTFKRRRAERRSSNE